MTTAESVTAEQFIAAPPARVWAALTQPDLVAKWWAPGPISANVGDSFVLDMDKWGGVECKVIESEPPTHFAYTFGDWTLTWTLQEVPDGTLLKLVHSGFDLTKQGDAFAFNNMGPGWSTIVLPRLAEMLEQERA